MKTNIKELKLKIQNEFIIPKYCSICNKQILTINDIGYEQEGYFMCKRCSNNQRRKLLQDNVNFEEEFMWKNV